MSEFLATLNYLVDEIREVVTSNKDCSRPYIGLEHIDPGSLKLRSLAFGDVSKGANFIFRSGDVLFGKLRPNLKKVAQAEVDGYCSMEILVLRPCPEVHPRFAAWTMQSERVTREAEASTEGTRMPRTSWPRLKTHPVYLPDFVQQRRIAEILDSLDEQIAAAEALTGKLHQLRTAAVDSLISGIFSPIRPLGDLLVERPRNGYSPKGVGSWTGVLALGLGCLTRDGFVPFDLKNIPKNDLRVKSALLTEGDLLMSRSNTPDLVGLVGRYRDVGVPCIYPDLMMRLRPHLGYSPRFLEFVFRMPRMRRQIQAAARGTSGSMVKINAEIVKRLLVPVPSEHDQTYVVAGVEVWTDRLSQERAALDKLRLLKKGLMEDLLTGKVRVTRSGELTG